MSASVDHQGAELSEIDGSEIDPIWTSSRTARQIYSLGQVEKVLVRSTMAHKLILRRDEQDTSRLLELAASSISLLTLPETDRPDEGLPQGDERSERFVLEVTEYFQRLDVSARDVHHLRSYIRQTDALFSLRRFKNSCAPHLRIYANHALRPPQ